MPQGLEVYNASGVLELSITDRITRILNSAVLTGASTGTIVDAGLLTGDPFWWVSADSSTFYATEPTINVSGDTISWDITPYGGTESYTIVYGVY